MKGKLFNTAKCKKKYEMIMIKKNKHEDETMVSCSKKVKINIMH